jgi:hypothetical protein
MPEICGVKGDGIGCIDCVAGELWLFGSFHTGFSTGMPDTGPGSRQIVLRTASFDIRQLSCGFTPFSAA